MQAPRVPPWADVDIGQIERERARREEDDTGELTPLVLTLGVLLLVAVILMAFIGVSAAGRTGAASGSDLSLPVDWADEPRRVTTGAPRQDIIVGEPSFAEQVSVEDVEIDLASAALDSDEAQESFVTLQGSGQADDLVLDDVEPVPGGALARESAVVAVPSSVVRRLQVVDDADEETNVSSAEAVPLSVGSTVALPAEPAPSIATTSSTLPTSTTTLASVPRNDLLVARPTPTPTPTTQLVARGFDIGDLAVDIGETTAIVHWRLAGPTADISGIEVSWSCCGETETVQRLDPTVRRLQLFELEPAQRYLIAVAAIGPNGRVIDRTIRTRTITTKQSGLGAPSPAYDVTAVAGPGPNQVTVKWSADTDEALGGFFVSVGCCGGPLDDKSSSIDDPSARVHVINRLERGETYAIDLVSKNVNFVGDVETAQRVYISLD